MDVQEWQVSRHYIDTHVLAVKPEAVTTEPVSIQPAVEITKGLTICEVKKKYNKQYNSSLTLRQ